MDDTRIFQIADEAEFHALSLAYFREQFRDVPAYRTFCNHLGKEPGNVKSVRDIPFLPVEFFKTHDLLPKGREAATIFRSSGTTGSVPSRHLVADLSLYRDSFLKGFQHFYGPVQDYCILALLPSYQERPDASLIYMVEELIRQSGHPGSGFIRGDATALQAQISNCDAAGNPVLLLGVSFALLDLVSKHPMELTHTIIMETGGMKGRKKEMVREALHKILCRGFGVDRIHSEYGMTELLSQAYSQGRGKFRCPPWMRVLPRDPEDPFCYLEHGRSGGLNIIDLANRYSCAFLATQDLGKTYPDGSFEVLGRFDHSDIRGCNLMAL